MKEARQETLEFWFYTEHLIAYMDLIASRIGYDFDDSDEYAIEAGVRDTDPFEHRWFEYPLSGEQGRVKMLLASVPGSHVVDCRIEGSRALVEEMRYVCEAMEVLRSRFHFLPTKYYREDVCREFGREILVYRRKDGR